MTEAGKHRSFVESLKRAQRALASPVGQRALHFASLALLLSLFASYLAEWLTVNWPMLTDVRLQTDDARTSLFPFHRYGAADALHDDPIASEMLALVPIGVQVMYRALVPFTDIYLAAKIVQALALLVLGWAAVILARSRRAGLAAAVLLVFVVLHDWFSINRVAGGLPRAFGFPCFALWMAGVLAQNRTARFLAPILSALTYPSVMNMILAAEGLLAVRGAFRIPWGVLLRRLRRYGLMVALCFMAVLPAVMGGDDRGPIHTLEQAEKEPAFGRKGRLWILPFRDPATVMSDAFIDGFRPRGESPLPKVQAAFQKDPEMYAVVLFGLFLCFPLLRLVPPPTAALAFFLGSGVLYFLSRVLAFRLYSPERYYSFGMRMAAMALILGCVVHAFYWVKPKWRTTLRNLVVSAVLFGVWAGTGSGALADNGMTIDSRRDARLYEFVRTLPKDVRIAGHLLDTDGIPYYGARATMGGFETLQPWFVDSWARQKGRMEETLTALYTDDRKAVLAYAKKHGVTHFLLNRNRYGKKMTRHIGSFDPFTGYARGLIKGKTFGEIALYQVPKEAVIYKEQRFSLVSVELLDKAWK